MRCLYGDKMEVSSLLIIPGKLWKVWCIFLLLNICVDLLSDYKQYIQCTNNSALYYVFLFFFFISTCNLLTCLLEFREIFALISKRVELCPWVQNLFVREWIILCSFVKCSVSVKVINCTECLIPGFSKCPPVSVTDLCAFFARPVNCPHLTLSHCDPLHK